MDSKPLKRHPALIPVSRDHHGGLLLCWKIRTGFRKSVPDNRIAAYTKYFFEHHLVPHFRLEEQEIFTFLPEQDALRVEAENQHKEIYRIVSELSEPDNNVHEILNTFEKALDKHIRFEERQLFMHIQEQLEEPELAALGSRVEACHTEEPEKWEDRFWE